MQARAVKTLFWPTAFAALAMAVLVGLGVWQLQRLDWKQSLIERIQARAHGAPVTLEDALRRWQDTRDVEYLRVRLEGAFDHEKETHLFTVRDGQAGWRVVTPFETESGHMALVDRGFVPHALKNPARRDQGQVKGRVAVVGLARAPEGQGLFVPDNLPEQNSWYWRDLNGMAEWALTEGDADVLAPFFIELEAGDVPGGWPKGGGTRLDLPNRHLQYALTWFGLACALAAVYGLFAYARLRDNGSRRAAGRRSSP